MFKIANAPCSWGVIEGIDGERGGYTRVIDEMHQTGYAGTESGDMWFMVFEVNMPDTACKIVNALQRISSRKRPMTGVEAQAQNGRVCHFKKPASFLGSFHPCADVVMKYSSKSGFVHHASSHIICAARKSLPLPLTHSQIRGDPTGVFGTNRIAVGIVA